MTRHPADNSDILGAMGALGADLAALRANLELTPAQRLAELVAMNRFHAEVQERTLSPELRAALEARDLEVARQRLRELEG